MTAMAARPAGAEALDAIYLWVATAAPILRPIWNGVFPAGIDGSAGMTGNFVSLPLIARHPSEKPA